jgi:FkbM family methyltransferase
MTFVFGSDVHRSRRQLWRRRAASAAVNLLGLNRPTPLATEFAQAIEPVATVETRHGTMLCRTGHGRLVWRAETFLTEEPGTVAWLDGLRPTDVLWDVGANVGLYSIYAAKFMGCRVFAFEPEAQNFALLAANVSMNDLGGRLLPSCLAVAGKTGMGRLRVRHLTKGGAYNLFRAGDEPVPESVKATLNFDEGFDQLMLGVSLDDLAAEHGVPAPTHVKIDVDGIEPQIVAGGLETLKGARSVLVELNFKSAADVAVIKRLVGMGFNVRSKRSIWESKGDAEAAAQMPAYNVIFDREDWR